MIDPVKSLSSKFAREAGITIRGAGNVAMLLAPVFAVAAFQDTGETSGLSNGINAIAAGASLVGGAAMNRVGTWISRLSSQPL